MSFTGIQATIDFYTMQEAYITNELTDIMTLITRASKETTSLVQENNYEKDSVRDNYAPGTADYEDAMSQIEDDYELKLAEITEWESELETKKDALETEIKATTSYKESFKSVLKQNIQKDFQYGGASSSS